MAHKWARWLHNPCRLGGPHRRKAKGKIRSGPQWGKVATSPLPPGGTPWLQSGGQNQKWPTSGQGGYITPAASGGPQRFKARGKIRSGPQWGKVATSPLPPGGSPPLKSKGQNHKGPQMGKVATQRLPPRGSPPLQSEGQSHKWPTSGQGGYITPAA